MSAKERLQAWFDNPDTLADAWEAYTLSKICKEASMSSTTVQNYLYLMVKDRHPEVSSYAIFRDRREAYGRETHKAGECLSDKDIEAIQTHRLSKTIHESAAQLGFSRGTVQNIVVRNTSKGKVSLQKTCIESRSR